MVSLRRRRLLGLCSGNNSFVTQLPLYCENLSGYEKSSQHDEPKSEQSMLSDIASIMDNVGTQPLLSEKSSQHGEPKSEQSVLSDIASIVDNIGTQPLLKAVVKDESGSSIVSGSSSPKEQPSQQSIGPPIKRKRQRWIKHMHGQELCMWRGVYFKNMKWQAAIKVDKQQIHLGTVGSQEEAAHLYDRAAFMIGREPNFELPEEEKEELRKFEWEEFVTMTRRGITSRKHKRRRCPRLRIEEPSLQKGDSDSKQGVSGSSASGDAEQETAFSRNI